MITNPEKNSRMGPRDIFAKGVQCLYIFKCKEFGSFGGGGRVGRSAHELIKYRSF